MCGRVAKHVAGPAVVRLKAPPPIETTLEVSIAEGVVQLLQGSRVIAEGRAAELDLSPPPPPTFGEAMNAAKFYAGFTRHDFPGCFVCGPQRAAGDGMRIFPGPIESRSIVAAPWIPDASLADGSAGVAAEFLWAALDCTSAFAVLPIPEDKTMVLGELCARTEGSVTLGEKCIAIGWRLQVDGRKRFAASAVFSESGVPVAVGRATWIEIQRGAFGSQ